MSVSFQNFDYTYRRKGKPVFAPSELGRKIGQDIKQQVERAYSFDDFVFHMQSGGHVGALHFHRDHRYFARVDIENFFYGIARNRVQGALSDLGIRRARHYAKWSCVKNPYGHPTYALPYGFVQSPILASLVLMESGVGEFLREISTGSRVRPSVYMDDISLSADNFDDLTMVFDALQNIMAASGFQISVEKLRKPALAMDIFNCDIRQGHSEVLVERIAAFEASERTQPSKEAFARYCLGVEAGNS